MGNFVKQQIAHAFFFVSFFCWIFNASQSRAGDNLECFKNIRKIVSSVSGASTSSNPAKIPPRSRLSRAFLRPVNHTGDDKFKLARFLVEYHPPKSSGLFRGQWISRGLLYLPRKITQGVYGKPYSTNIIGGTVFNLFHRPTRMLFRNTPQGPLDLRPWSSLSLSAGVFVTSGIWVFSKIDQENAQLMAEHVLEKIEEDKELWDKKIQFDFRYVDIKSDLLGGLSTPVEARQSAYLRFLALEEFYQFENDPGSEFEHLSETERHQIHLKFWVHQSIANFVFKGVPVSESFHYLENFEPELSIPQITNLIAVNRAKFAMDQVIVDYVVGDKKLKKEMISNENLKTMVEYLENDSFAIKLRERNLSQEELIFRLQEDNFWRVRFFQMEILKIQKKKIVNGVLTNEILTLEDIRKETLNELGN